MPAAARWRRRSAPSTRTNLTPDAETGIGRWSFSAFQRAMREGISRDGQHLYPAFPYTAFAQDQRRRPDGAVRLPDGAAARCARRRRRTQLRFPVQRAPADGAVERAVPRPGAVRSRSPTHSAEWNRGAYLVNGLGHCGACHTPRNALGAEQGGSAFLAGAMVEGWEAPALTGAVATRRCPGPPTSCTATCAHGHTPQHGIAGGPDGAGGAASSRGCPTPTCARWRTTSRRSTRRAGERAGRRRRPARPRSGPARAALLGAGAAPVHERLRRLPPRRRRPRPAGREHAARAQQQPAQRAARQPAARHPRGHARAGRAATSASCRRFGDALDDAQIAELAGYMRQRFAPQAAGLAGPAGAGRARAAGGRRIVTASL